MNFGTIIPMVCEIRRSVGRISDGVIRLLLQRGPIRFAIAPYALRMKKLEKFYVCIVAFILALVTMPSQAEEQSTSITQNLGSHAYVIPRDLIEMIDKPDYSGMPSPNANWPHDPVVRLAVQWPEFTASTDSNRQDKAKRKITISMAKGSTRTIAQVVERLDALHFAPKISNAQYGLKELRSHLSRNFREYIATPEGGPEYLIHCDQPEREIVAMLYHACDYNFEYFDLEVNVYFSSPFLSNWLEIHQKTLALLNSMRKD